MNDTTNETGAVSGNMAPARPEGARFHECEECRGSGAVTILGVESECAECDGTGEWFE
jgi:DnaJ-class molecular chaperone